MALSVLTVVLFLALKVNSEAADVACSRIQSALGTTITQTFQGPEHNSTATGAWNLVNDLFHPTCIVFPRKTTDVQVAMKAIYEAKARYSVQAGGHSAMQGWNNVQDGVLIAFSHMQNVSYDISSQAITLEPGVHWEDAVSMLAPLGVAPVGGRQGDVGMGLLLGGGLSYLSPSQGFAADSFKELDVVLVTGEMVTASASQHSDLFKALKGGGNRFGIVTRYQVEAVQTGTEDDKNWFGGSITYPVSSAEAFMKAIAHYVRDVKDPKAVLLGIVLNINVNGSLVAELAADIFYHGNSLPDTIFGELLSIPGASAALTPLSYLEVASSLPSGNDRGSTSFYGASAFGKNETQYLDAFSHFMETVSAFADEAAIVTLAFTPVLQPQIDAGRARGGNAIDPPDGGYAAVQINQQLLPGLTAVSRKFEEARRLLFKQLPRSPGLPLFLNECDKGQNVFETYGDYGFLKKTYKKYDPDRFNVKHMDGPIGL
ncbi:FAD-binding domain-containing protein [Mycena floridula]|nr:FAD-binding domain-containing protein [Mycena floridula]